MRKIITIAREFGAGGRSVGKAVAERLGIAFYDRDLILKTAEQSSHLTADEIRRYDEKAPFDAGFTQSLFDFYTKPLSEQIFNAQRDAIRQIAEKESCVLVGRNADYILREFDHLLRVFIYAEKEWKIEHMKELMPDSSRSEIESHMAKVDKVRKNYTSKFTGQTYGLAANYDICINTSKLGFDKAVDYIVDAAAKI